MGNIKFDFIVLPHARRQLSQLNKTTATLQWTQARGLGPELLESIFRVVIPTGTQHNDAESD